METTEAFTNETDYFALGVTLLQMMLAENVDVRADEFDIAKTKTHLLKTLPALNYLVEPVLSLISEDPPARGAGFSTLLDIVMAYVLLTL